MDNPFPIVLSALGALLIVAGICVVLGRRRIARNIQAARASKPSENGVAWLGVLQVALGVASLAAAWLPLWRNSAQIHSLSIRRLFEDLGQDGGILGIIVMLVGFGGVVVAVWLIASFLRSARASAQDGLQLSPSDLRRVYLAATSLILGVLALYSGFFFLPGA